MQNKTLKNLLATAAIAVCTLASPAAHAVDYLTASVGQYDALRRDYDSPMFGLEYRGNAMQYHFRPIAGGFINTDGGAYGYAGVNWEVPVLANQLYLIPNFAVGAYRQGSSKDLGGALEFRSGIELDYQFENFQRVGVLLNHLSNASIYKHNSGVEAVLVNYSIPVATITGGY